MTAGWGRCTIYGSDLYSSILFSSAQSRPLPQKRREGKMRASFGFGVALLALASLLTPQAIAQAQFPTEGQAQQHCPSDVVVWLNLPSGIYHLKGERWYGRTKSGAYVC